MQCSAVQYKSWKVYPYRRCNYVSCFSFQSSTLPTALLKQCMQHTVRSFHGLINCSMMTLRVTSSTPFPSGSQVRLADRRISYWFCNQRPRNHEANLPGNTEFYGSLRDFSVKWLTYDSMSAILRLNTSGKKSVKITCCSFDSHLLGRWHRYLLKDVQKKEEKQQQSGYTLLSTLSFQSLNFISIKIIFLISLVCNLLNFHIHSIL